MVQVCVRCSCIAESPWLPAQRCCWALRWRWRLTHGPRLPSPAEHSLAGSSALSQTDLVTGLISKLTLGLANAAHDSEDAFVLHARRLSTAIQVTFLVALHPSPSYLWSLEVLH